MVLDVATLRLNSLTPRLVSRMVLTFGALSLFGHSLCSLLCSLFSILGAVALTEVALLDNMLTTAGIDTYMSTFGEARLFRVRVALT